MRPTLVAAAALLPSRQDVCFAPVPVECFSTAQWSLTQSFLRSCSVRRSARAAPNETEKKKLLPFRRRDRGGVQVRPGSELFPPKGSSYVPSGMSREEYEQIKKQEAEIQSKMNFGAWGPRFLPSTERPDGDWMVIPSLWTGGYSANDQTSQHGRGLRTSPKPNTAPAPIAPPPTRKDGVGRVLAYYSRPFFAAYVALSLLVNAAAVTRLLFSDSLWNTIRVTLASPPAAQRSLHVTSLVLLQVFALRRREQLWQLLLPLWTHSLVSRLAVATVLAYPLDRILMRPLQRRGWARNQATRALCSGITATCGLWIASMIPISSFCIQTVAALWASVRA